jgi:uncharacterized protein (DUF885 family)
MAEADRADLLRMRRTPLLCLATMLSAGLLAPVAAAPTQTATVSTPATAAALQAILAEAQALQRERPPALPLPAGADRRYSARMPFASEDYVQKRAARAASLLDRLKAVDQSKLSAADQLDVFIVSDRLQQTVAEAKFKTYLVPISDAGGFHVQFANDVGSRSFASVADYDEYVARLQSFKELTTAQIGLMRLGIASGNTLPGPSMAPDYVQTIRQHVVDAPEQSVFFAPLTTIPEAVPAADRERIVRDGTAAIRESVLPAYREFLAFMSTDYLPKVRPSVGLSDVPGGREYYESLVRHYTTLDITAQEVHEIGLSEVSRLRAEMQAVISRVGFGGTFAQFLDFLRTDPRFYVTDPQQYIKEASYIQMRMQGQLLRLFRRLPETPLGIRPFPDTPASLRGTGANYGPGQPGVRAGSYNLNLTAIKSRPLYVLEALTFHEGIPGHHTQIMLHYENRTISELRRQADVTAFVEGWALYAERLGLEVGFYTDPYSDFGRLTYEIWRACRLVVDTGIHAFGWTRQRAIEYMTENTALSVHEVTTEVDRYIRSRGQALAYKMGELRITAARRRAEQALGPKFDVRDFHDAVLSQGSVPLVFLDRQVDQWIGTVKAKSQ